MPHSISGLGILGKILGSMRHARYTDMRVKSLCGLLGLTCILCLYEAQISGERLQDHWSSGLFMHVECEIEIHVIIRVNCQGMTI